MVAKKQSKRITRIARPYATLHQKKSRWYIATFNTQIEAEKKAESLINRGQKLVLLVRVMAEVRPSEEETTDDNTT